MATKRIAGGLQIEDDLSCEAGVTVQDDLECLASAHGVILHSPNSTRYRITVDNAGTLVATALSRITARTVLAAGSATASARSNQRAPFSALGGGQAVVSAAIHVRAHRTTAPAGAATVTASIHVRRALTATSIGHANVTSTHT